MLKIFRIILLVFLDICFLTIAWLYWSMIQAFPTTPMEGEGYMAGLGILMLIVLPVLGICFLFIIPQPQKWLPWMGVLAYACKPLTIGSRSPVPKIPIQVEPIVDLWISLAVSIVLASITAFCLFCNTRKLTI